MMQGLKNRTRRALGLRKKDKDTDTTSSPDREGAGSGKKKKANGAPNGFYGEIDWDRYATPDVDEEGFSLRPGDEGDDILSATEEKSETQPGEEIARPRRSTPTPSPAPEITSDRLSQNVPSFFGLPSETKYARYDVVPADMWVESRPRSDSPLSISFPTGAPPPLPPKNIPSRSHYGYPSESAADLTNGRGTRSSAPIYLNVLSPASYQGSEGPEIDDVFGPVDSPQTSEEAMSPRWVTFPDDRPPPPDEPAPPPPPDSPAPDTPSSTPSTPCLSPGPPPDEPPPSPPPFPPRSPPPFTPPESPPSIVLGPPPPDEPAPPLPPDFSPSRSPPVCLDEEALDEEVLLFAAYSSSPAPISPVPPLPAERRSPRIGVTSPLVLGGAGGKRTPEGAYLRDDIPDFVGSPRELTPSFRGTPPPLPPTTYRSIMSSPGPYSGSGPSSPARPATPQSRGSPVPPPPPPRPSSRPKLPPGKPITDLTRPFSPPVSGSPPPFAPLARSESSSSISSITSQSAASTPTLGRDLNMSTTGCSRGPSPLTMGPQDTLPVAAAFTETINAYFKGADPS
ncbi:unnamed protein product, partial [Pleuronectes platessa]